jgi:muramoyltetrapeptide carboxypeptidase
VDVVTPRFNGVMLAPMVTRPLAMPEPLAPGDVAIIVAPSSPEAREELWRGLAWLRTRYRLRMSASALEREGYLAGSDARRRDELARAMLDSEAKAIFTVRGGYGALRIAADLPWLEFARRPKWLVGFSDVTVLHAMAASAGVASVHGPNVSRLGGASPRVRARWLNAVEHPAAVRSWEGLRIVRAGSATGPIAGGNLALLHAMAAAGRLELPPGAILLLEDVGEAPYRLDRMLTSLLLGGHLRDVGAIVLGAFERCGSAGTDAIDELVRERTSSLRIPVLAGAPFGHCLENEAFVLGRTGSLVGAELRFQ